MTASTGLKLPEPAGPVHAGGARPRARLSFEAGGSWWLLRLEDSGEVLPVPVVEPVPLTQGWFLGVANVRGTIYGVSDFAAFLGAAPASRGPDNRLLLIGQPFGLNLALLVARVGGLRGAGELTRAEAPPAAASWAGDAWCDAQGRPYRELDAVALMEHPRFIDVSLHSGSDDAADAERGPEWR